MSLEEKDNTCPEHAKFVHLESIGDDINCVGNINGDMFYISWGKVNSGSQNGMN